MFTGLVVSKAVIKDLDAASGGIRLTLRFPEDEAGWKLGESVALNGCCLTVVRIEGPELQFDAGPETLSKTTMGQWRVGQPINFERSLCVGDRLGGHFLTGHIDGTGTVTNRTSIEDTWLQLRIHPPRTLMAQIAVKGSVAIDGVSLTVNDVDDQTFSVALIPHTLEITNLGILQPGHSVNLETDILAKYVQRAMLYYPPTERS